MKEQIEKIILETLVIENKQSIHHAVDKISEYAKQQAVEFTEHLTTMNVQRIGKDSGWEIHGLAENGMFPIMTTEELYELFIQEQSKTK